jgi:hypothetical protein
MRTSNITINGQSLVFLDVEPLLLEKDEYETLISCLDWNKFTSVIDTDGSPPRAYVVRLDDYRVIAEREVFSQVFNPGQDLYKVYEYPENEDLRMPTPKVRVEIQNFDQLQRLINEVEKHRKQWEEENLHD